MPVLIIGEIQNTRKMVLLCSSVVLLALRASVHSLHASQPTFPGGLWGVIKICMCMWAAYVKFVVLVVRYTTCGEFACVKGA